MPRLFEIPLVPGRPRTFSMRWSSGVYNFRFWYADAPEAGWVMDIANSFNIPLICGIPLLPGVDLLLGYQYLGFTEKLVVSNELNRSIPPGFNEVGVTGHLYVEFP